MRTCVQVYKQLKHFKNTVKSTEPIDSLKLLNS